MSLFLSSFTFHSCFYFSYCFNSSFPSFSWYFVLPLSFLCFPLSSLHSPPHPHGPQYAVRFLVNREKDNHSISFSTLEAPSKILRHYCIDHFPCVVTGRFHTLTFISRYRPFVIRVSFPISFNVKLFSLSLGVKKINPTDGAINFRSRRLVWWCVFPARCGAARRHTTRVVSPTEPPWGFPRVRSSQTRS